MTKKIDGCKFCGNNKSGYEQGYWCATNCISGSKFILKEKLRSQKLNVHENVNIIDNWLKENTNPEIDKQVE